MLLHIWNAGQISQIISVSTEGIYSVEVTSPEGCTYR